MRTLHWCFLILVFVISGCSNTSDKKQNTSSIETEDVAMVINALKDELSLFANTQPSVLPNLPQACGDSRGNTYIGLTPLSATLELKVISTNLIGGNVGAKIPVATTGLTIDPGVSGNISRLNTQQMTVELGIDHKKTEMEIRAEIDKMDKEVTADEKYAKTQSRIFKEKVDQINKSKKDKILSEYTKLIERKNSDSTISPTTPYSDVSFKDRPLAEALYRIRESLLAVDHTKEPCLKPNQLKAEIAFQITKKVGGSLGLSFFVVSLGGELSHTDDRTHRLTVLFDMAESSSSFFVQ